MRRQSGFTLIELMIILAVVAIVAGFGVPQIIGLIQNNRTVSVINNLSANLQYARSEAVKRASNVNIIANGANQRRWDRGWTVYIDANNDNVVDAGEELRIVENLNNSTLTIRGPNGNLAFAGDGSNAGGTEQIFTVTDSKASTVHEIKVSPTGNVRINKKK